MERSGGVRVSVVIPTYNRWELLQQALESVREQTYRDIEVIVVDDGSTDATREVVAASPLKPIYLFQNNRGRGAARNLGVMRASGELVAFLDSDDLWHRDRLARHVAFLSKNPDAVFVHGPVDVIDEKGRRDEAESERMARLYRKAARRGFGLESLLDSCLIFSSAVTVRRTLFEEVGLFDPTFRILEDLEWYLRVAQQYRICFLEGPPVASYRIHRGNAYRTGDRTVLETYRKIFSRYLDAGHPNSLSAAVRAQANLSLSFCYAGLGEGRRVRQHIRAALALRPRSVLRMDVVKRLARSMVSGVPQRGVP